MTKLLIIYYHEVVENGQGFSYQKIEKDKFESQMKYLHDQGYHTLLFSELDKPLPDKAIIVSFDDGFRSVYENAAPIMKKNGIRGNIYLPTRYIGIDEHFMTWEMIKELSENNVCEMQAHTHNHVDIRRLNNLELTKEIQKSDELFQKELGVLPKALCMPFGVYDRKLIKMVRNRNRYKYLLGSYYGRIKPNNIEKCVLPRIGISNDDDMKKFVDKLEGKYDWKGPLQRLRLVWKNIKKERIVQYEY